ncbi:hypothetical protein OB919_15895 [Halobacteria archaeon AArc-curdl1]|uniref:Uncharacterized protein n=1 Tax=Natronosalvus hydrolyticus TaxID=2979988 RepID=A0AAP3E7Z8_9EURY|nr:hypothetical protein [Halobacteria archaeon AArc-curdl1]
MATDQDNSGIPEIRRDTTLSDIAIHIENRDVEKTKELIASDEEDEQHVDRFFYHRIGRKEKISDVQIVFQSPNYLIVRTEEYRRTRPSYNEPRYIHEQEHTEWVVGYDPDQESGFFIHELQSDKRIDDPDFEWTEEEIREKMGFTREYQGGDLQPGETYRLQGDITIKKEEDKSKSGIKYRKSREVVDEQSDIRKALRKKIIEQAKPQIEGISDKITVNSCQKTVDPLKIESSESEELKQIQRQAGISENKIRDLQDERDGWEVLTAKRRKQLIKEILWEPVEEKIADLIDEQEVRRTAEKRVNKDWSNSEGQYNVQLGNHILLFSNAIQHSRRRVSVRDRSKLYVIHDEHQNLELTLDRGVYRVDVLDRAR